MKTTALIIAAAIPLTAAEPTTQPAPLSPTRAIVRLGRDEAKKVDENKDGEITGTEVTVLKMQYAKNPTSWLSVYDDNANKQLDDEEINDLKWGPALEKVAAKDAAKAAKKKK